MVNLELIFRTNVEPDTNHPGCLRWRGKTGRARYYSVEGILHYIHHIAFEAFKGPIPNGQIIHHICENPECVNPEHLRSLTRAEHATLHHKGKIPKNIQIIAGWNRGKSSWNKGKSAWNEKAMSQEYRENMSRILKASWAKRKNVS